MIHPRQSSKLYGQNAAAKLFLDASSSGNLHHAWLLVGERGVGKATFAYAAAKYLLSSSQSQALEIAPDNDIAKKIANSSHPDLFVLELEDGEKEIKVDAARELATFTSLTPALGHNKVIIIDSINELNNNAANSLLKLLEEPQDNTYLFLVCHSLANILPTIRSRCRQLKFLPLTFEAFFSIIQAQTKLDREDALELYDLAQGSMYYAKLLLTNGALDVYKATEDLLQADKRDYQDLQKLMALAHDDENWEIIKFALHQTMHKMLSVAAQNNSLSEKQMEMTFKRLNLIQQTDVFHLDRAQLIAAITSSRS
jgi:DNA polymerase-3 subunit delta'